MSGLVSATDIYTCLLRSTSYTPSADHVEWKIVAGSPSSIMPSVSLSRLVGALVESIASVRATSRVLASGSVHTSSLTFSIEKQRCPGSESV